MLLNLDTLPQGHKVDTLPRPVDTRTVLGTLLHNNQDIPQAQATQLDLVILQAMVKAAHTLPPQAIQLLLPMLPQDTQRPLEDLEYLVTKIISMLSKQAIIPLKVIPQDSQVLIQAGRNRGIPEQHLDIHMSPHHKMSLCVAYLSMIGVMIHILREHPSPSLGEELHMYLPEERLLDMNPHPHSRGMHICANPYVKNVAGDESIDSRTAVRRLLSGRTLRLLGALFRTLTWLQIYRECNLVRIHRRHMQPPTMSILDIPERTVDL